jgi:hypothetical protein
METFDCAVFSQTVATRLAHAYHGAKSSIFRDQYVEIRKTRCAEEGAAASVYSVNNDPHCLVPSSCLTPEALGEAAGRQMCSWHVPISVEALNAEGRERVMSMLDESHVLLAQIRAWDWDFSKMCEVLQCDDETISYLRAHLKLALRRVRLASC